MVSILIYIKEHGHTKNGNKEKLLIKKSFSLITCKLVIKKSLLIIKT